MVKLVSRSKVYLKSQRDLDLELDSVIAMSPTTTHHETFLSWIRFKSLNLWTHNTPPHTKSYQSIPRFQGPRVSRFKVQRVPRTHRRDLMDNLVVHHIRFDTSQTCFFKCNLCWMGVHFLIHAVVFPSNIFYIYLKVAFKYELDSKEGPSCSHY